MAQQVAQYINPVLQAFAKLGGSARPAEVYAQIADSLELSDAVLDATK